MKALQSYLPPTTNDVAYFRRAIIVAWFLLEEHGEVSPDAMWSSCAGMGDAVTRLRFLNALMQHRGSFNFALSSEKHYSPLRMFKGDWVKIFDSYPELQSDLYADIENQKNASVWMTCMPFIFDYYFRKILDARGGTPSSKTYMYDLLYILENGIDQYLLSPQGARTAHGAWNKFKDRRKAYSDFFANKNVTKIAGNMHDITTLIENYTPSYYNSDSDEVGQYQTILVDETLWDAFDYTKLILPSAVLIGALLIYRVVKVKRK